MNATQMTLAQELAHVNQTIEALIARREELLKAIELETQQQEVPTVATKQSSKSASRVKRGTKRDIEPDAAERIDTTKAQAYEHKPEKVAQSKGVTKKTAPKAEKAKKGKRTHEGMSYSEVRAQVSERKSKLNKADQERMSKAGLKNNTWEGAIASLEWLNKYFPAK